MSVTHALLAEKAQQESERGSVPFQRLRTVPFTLVGQQIVVDELG
jgi:hypothetical protein